MRDRLAAVQQAQEQAEARQTGTLREPQGSDTWRPPTIAAIDDTGLNMIALADLAIKILYFSGFKTGYQMAEIIKLPFTGIMDQVMELLKREKWVEVKGTGGFGEGAFQYVITEAGTHKAREVLERSQYAGPAPVTLEAYIAAINAQTYKSQVTQAAMTDALKHLVVSDDIMNKVGPAVNSAQSIFLFGPPGNGKTTISEAVGRLVLGEDLYIPYAIDIDGQIVRVFDSVNHEVIATVEDEKPGTGQLKKGAKRDPRWVKIRRPVIIVGGELTLDGLDLVYDPINKYYEAPFQVKANGGMFLIDDFGRQQVRPRDLLNRWIVPLEKRVDFLTLHTGRKLEIPFDVMIVFSTNLEPRDLVDEAFLRRIRHKIEIGDPSFEEFREIFRRMCIAKDIEYTDQGLAYLLQEWYIKQNRKLRAVHPRDILNQLVDIAAYLNVPARLTKDLIDRSCHSYFVEL